MLVGCFSWCHRLPRWFFTKGTAESPTENFSSGDYQIKAQGQKIMPAQDIRLVDNEDAPANQLQLVSEPEEYTYPEMRVGEIKSNDKLDDISTSIPIRRYVVATVKETLKVMESAAGVIPVPMLQDAIGIASKIIELCEEASAVEQKVKELQGRVGDLMIIVLAHITDKNEDGDTAKVLQAAKRIEDDIIELLNILTTIDKELTAVKSQNRGLLIIFKGINMSTLDDCLDKLSAALEKFKLANDLRDSDLLKEVHTRLGTMSRQVDGISKDVKHVVATVDNIQQNFDQVMARVKRSATLLSSSRQRMPLKPEVFEGREGLVEDVVRTLTEEEAARICILGPGGMGKTSVALAVVETTVVRKKYATAKHLWVPCTGATSAPLLLEILYIQLQVPGDKQITLEKILTHLDSTDDPFLILLDNFETPWNAPGSQKEVGDILRQLAQLSCVAILMTMRGKYPPCEKSIRWQSMNIEPTDEGASLRIFQEINPSSRDDPDVGKLLHALGYMPFAIALMASLGKEADMNAAQLLQAWSKSGPDIFSNEDEEHSINRSISLSVDSPLLQQNSNAKLLLSVLSLLPAGTTRENLQWWAPTLETSMLPSAIAALSKTALLLENKQQDAKSSILFVVPVVQSFMQQHRRIPDEVREQIHSSCCRYVLAHECRYDHPEFEARSKALAAEDANIQSILFNPSGSKPTSDISEMTLEALIAFCWHRCDTRPSPDLAKHALEVAEASGIERHINAAKWCLGRTYFIGSEYSLAFQHLKKASEFFSSPGDLQWQKLGGRCGIDLVDSALMMPAYEETLRLAYDVEASCATLSDPQVHGRSLAYVGFALQRSGQGEEALKYLERAKIALEGAGSPLDNADVYQAIGRVHYQERRISRALEVMEEAWRYAEMSNVASSQGYISSDLGKILYSANRDADARRYIEKALVLLSQVGSISEVGVALEYMGYDYLRQGDYQDAYSAYDAAAEHFGKCGWNHERTMCHANMEKIAQKLKNLDEQIGFKRPVWDPDKSLLYPPGGPAEAYSSSITPSVEAA